MPREQHYHQAHEFLGTVRGADAADERRAVQESIEQLARLFELAETYQDVACRQGDHAAQLNGTAQQGSGSKAA